jgi:dienelactone hydrolase
MWVFSSRGAAPIGVLACALTIAACGGGDDSSTTSVPERTNTDTTASRPSHEDKAPELVRGCDAGPGWHALQVHGALQAAVLGGERTAVVLANDSGNQVCDWMSFARELEGKGIAVAVFSYSIVGNPRDIATVANALRRQGAERVAAIGASVGGRAVVELAARDDPSVDAVVSLSGEREIGTQYPDILPQAKRVQLPILYAGSQKDGYTSFGKETVQLHEATPAKINEMLLVPGSDHGVDLLSGPPAKRVRPAIVAFLRKTVIAGD